MKNKFLIYGMAVTMTALLLTGCGETTQTPDSSRPVVSVSSEAETIETAQSVETSAESSEAESDVAESTEESTTESSGVSAEIGGTVEGMILTEGLEEILSYYVFDADNSEYRVSILFNAVGTVSDFRFKELQLIGMDEALHMEFEELTVYSLERLDESCPLVVNMTFVGDTPNYGISYFDGENVRTFALEMSGEDGSLILLEY